MSKVTQIPLLVALLCLSVTTVHSEGLPDPGVEFNKGRVGIVITDP